MTRTIHGQVPVRVARPRTIATDGSAVRKGDHVYWGFGWISTDGSYGCGGDVDDAALMGPAYSLVAELRAIWNVVKPRVPERSLLVLTDSLTAMSYLDSWAAGVVYRMPAGYHGHTLGLMAAFVAEHHPAIAWAKVPGHRGHLLNEAADSLAKIGREMACGAVRKRDADERARRLVSGFLADPRLAEVA